MAADVSYDELLRRVPLWLYAENTALAAEMPAIIGRAEDHLVNVLDHDIFQTVLTSKTIGASPVNVVTDDDKLDLSAETPRLMELRSIRIAYKGGADWTPVEPRNDEMLSMLYSRNRPARPRYYGQHGDQLKLKFYPFPDRVYTLKITANVMPVRMAVGVQNNKISTMFPRAFESAVFHQAAIFMQDQPMADKYQAEMMAAIPEANLASSRKRRDETGTRPIETTNAAGR